MENLRFLLLAAAVIASASVAAQTTYRWTDASGKTVFSDQPPPAGARQVVRSDGELRGDTPQLPYATRQAAGKFPVALYTAASCTEVCTRARTYLNERAIPWSEKIVASDEQNAELAKLLGGTAAVPTLVVGRQSVAGFEAGAWGDLIDLAGYPKSATRGGGTPGIVAQ